MGGEVMVPESVLKKRKREEEWAVAKKEEIAALKKKNAENRQLIYKRAKEYAKEYEEQAKELIRLKREAKLKGGFYVNPEAKLLFIIRIRGINAMHPKTRKILQLLRLRQVMWVVCYVSTFPTLENDRLIILFHGDSSGS
uniref:60S ribosomal protein L7-4 n=1 Tax=Rhizophora mucronata TaxID=61149 RepID=A0A2P2JX86_RHIMU